MTFFQINAQISMVKFLAVLPAYLKLAYDMLTTVS